MRARHFWQCGGHSPPAAWAGLELEADRPSLPQLLPGKGRAHWPRLEPALACILRREKAQGACCLRACALQSPRPWPRAMSSEPSSEPSSRVVFHAVSYPLSRHKHLASPVPEGGLVPPFEDEVPREPGPHHSCSRSETLVTELPSFSDAPPSSCPHCLTDVL